MNNAAFKIAVTLSAYDKMTATMNKAFSGAQSKLAGLQKSSARLADNSFRAGRDLIGAGMATAAPLIGAVKSATDFETKMIDIRKQLKNDTPEAVAAMTEQIFEMGRTIPKATGEIQEMIASGLRMGIAEDKIVDYTKQVSKMSVAFDMGAEEIADSMGKISNVFKIPIDKIGDFGDAINYLDDQTMAKGPELIDVLQRIGGSARNLDPKAAAAFSATMLSLGESAETSGSGLSSMLNKLSAASMQGKKFQDGLGMLGLNAAELQKAMSDKSTAQPAILSVFERISKLDPSKQTEALVRLFGAEHGPKLMKLANNTKLLTENLKMMDGAYKNSMQKEYEKRVQSTAAKFQMLKNQAMEIAVRVGTALLPTVTALIDKLMKMAKPIVEWIKNNKELVAGIGKAIAIFSGLALTGGYLSFVIGGVSRFFSIMSGAIGWVVKAVRFLIPIFRVLWFLLRMFPLVRIIALIIALAAILIRNWTWVKTKVMSIVSALVQGFQRFLTWIKGFGKNVIDFITWPFRTVYNWVMNLGPKFVQAGSNIITSIINGIKAMINKPIELVKKMVGKIRNLLPFSPAKDGPLKDIHRIKLVETIAATVKPQSLLNAFQKVTGAARDFLFGPTKTGAIQARAGGSNGGPNVTININLSGGATQTDGAAIIAEAKKQFEKYMNSYHKQKQRVSF